MLIDAVTDQPIVIAMLHGLIWLDRFLTICKLAVCTFRYSANGVTIQKLNIHTDCKKHR